MHITDVEIKQKIEEILCFRRDAGLNYRSETNEKLKEDYLIMWNLLTCKIDAFLQDMDSILYPEKEE